MFEYEDSLIHEDVMKNALKVQREKYELIIKNMQQMNCGDARFSMTIETWWIDNQLHDLKLPPIFDPQYDVFGTNNEST